MRLRLLIGEIYLGFNICWKQPSISKDLSLLARIGFAQWNKLHMAARFCVSVGDEHILILVATISSILG